MYKETQFQSKLERKKLDCLYELALFLNDLGNVTIATIEKEWEEQEDYFLLSAFIIYDDLSAKEYKYDYTCPSCSTYNETWKKRENTVKGDIVFCWHCGEKVKLKGDI